MGPLQAASKIHARLLSLLSSAKLGKNQEFSHNPMQIFLFLKQTFSEFLNFFFFLNKRRSVKHSARPVGGPGGRVVCGKGMLVK